jgi:hypothetical protein
MSPDAQQLDWATFIVPVTYEELVGYVGSGKLHPGQRHPDPRAKIKRLSPDRTYVLVSVEGL